MSWEQTVTPKKEDIYCFRFIHTTSKHSSAWHHVRGDQQIGADRRAEWSHPGWGKPRGAATKVTHMPELINPLMNIWSAFLRNGSMGNDKQYWWLTQHEEGLLPSSGLLLLLLYTSSHSAPLIQWSPGPRHMEKDDHCMCIWWISYDVICDSTNSTQLKMNRRYFRQEWKQSSTPLETNWLELPIL